MRTLMAGFLMVPDTPLFRAHAESMNLLAVENHLKNEERKLELLERQRKIEERKRRLLGPGAEIVEP